MILTKERSAVKLADAITFAQVPFTGTQANIRSLTKQAFQATITGSGAVTATIIVEVSLDGSNWLTLSTISLSGTTTASDGFTADTGFDYVRARVTAGTSGATVTVIGAI